MSPSQPTASERFINGILPENPVYRGDIVWNWRTESKSYTVRNSRADHVKPTQESGRVGAMPRDDWIVIEDAVPAVIDCQT